MTPVQQRGIIVNETKLLLVSQDHSLSDLGKVWVVSEDDGTNFPFFDSTDGSEKTRCFALADMHAQIIQQPLAPSLPTPAVPVSGVQTPYTELQQIAINVFQAMYDGAVAYRNGESTTLNHFYGICDNIDRYARAHGCSESPMSEVKENLIRQTEIYSGSYTYPVPCPDGGDASEAFNRHSDKWGGPYGFNRLLQLGQLIDLIKSDKWDDSMVLRKTPAFRNGLTIGDVVVYTRRNSPTYWVFRYDDESTSPSFHKIGDSSEYTDLDLSYVKKVDKACMQERTVAQFLEELNAKREEQELLNKQIAELQAALIRNESAIALLDYGLADQHKVKRIS